MVYDLPRYPFQSSPPRRTVMSSATQVTAQKSNHLFSRDLLPGGLYGDEYLWRDHQPWLADSGYMLRPRYRPEWEPSWLKSKKSPLDCEDGESPLVSRLHLFLMRNYNVL